MCARCAIYLLQIKQIHLSYRLAMEFTILKRVQNQFEMLLEMSIVLAGTVSAEVLDGYVTTPISIFCCGECGAWLCCFCVTRERKDDKNGKNTFFLLEKDELFTRRTIFS